MFFLIRLMKFIPKFKILNFQIKNKQLLLQEHH